VHCSKHLGLSRTLAALWEITKQFKGSSLGIVFKLRMVNRTRRMKGLLEFNSYDSNAWRHDDEQRQPFSKRVRLIRWQID